MAKKKPAPAKSVPVETHKHVADKRPNIPTRETAAFAHDHAAQPFVVHRDRSLDPQLVWKGKDEQDAQPLEVPAVPLHVQEKVHPLAIVEDVKRRAAGPKPVGSQLDLFADFNGLDDFAKKLEFYQHDQHWTNRLILGDSLLVMAGLAEKERLRGQVQCVYFDPPYGIKFPSNWQVSTRKRDVKDAKAEDLTRQPEQIKAFRDTWQLGIHSYLPYLRDRLVVARELLTESGSVFVQIGDENVHLVRSLLDEVLGSENFISQITFGKTSGATAEYLPAVSDYLLWYGKRKGVTKYRELYELKGPEGRIPSAYNRIELADGSRRSASGTEKEGKVPAGACLYSLDNLTSPRVRQARTGYFPIEHGGKQYLPTTGEWKTHREGIERLKVARRIEATTERIGYVRFLDDFPAIKRGNVWTDTVSSFMADKVYVVQTNVTIAERCLLMTTD